MLITASESGGFDLHDADEWYDGHLAAIEETDGEWGPGLKWVINLEGETDPINDEPRETWAYCSQKLSPRSKLYAWLKGLDQNAIPAAGDTVDLDQFIGKPVQIMFERYQGMDRDGNPQEKEKVVKLRAGKGKAKPQLKAVKADAPDESPF